MVAPMMYRVLFGMTVVVMNFYRLGRKRMHGTLLMLSGFFCLSWSLAHWSGKSIVDMHYNIVIIIGQ